MQEKPKFICRCSSIGKIMTDTREKSNKDKYNDAVSSLSECKEKYANTVNKERKTAQNLLERIKKLEVQVKDLEKFKDEISLSKTARTTVEEWMKSVLGYPRQEFSNKYTRKGLMMEDEAISFASKFYGWEGVVKNTERRTNEFITGEPDIILNTGIIDIKNNWSADQFPLMATEIPIDGYVWQGLGYMNLWDKDLFQLTYVLMDAPEIIVDQEANRKRFELGLDEVDAELWEEVKSKHTYSHLPDALRLKSFVFENDKEMMESVYERVELCRKWVDQTGFYELLAKHGR